MGKPIERYSDIIDLPHHQSSRRPHMTIHNRAAQFAPFAALTGYDSMVRNTADLLLLDKRINIDDDWKTLLDHKLQTILETPNQPVKITYFDEHANELGGGYIEYQGTIQSIKDIPKRLSFIDRKDIFVEDIVDIIFWLFCFKTSKRDLVIVVLPLPLFPVIAIFVVKS